MEARSKGASGNRTGLLIELRNGSTALAQYTVELRVPTHLPPPATANLA